MATKKLNEVRDRTKVSVLIGAKAIKYAELSRKETNGNTFTQMGNTLLYMLGVKEPNPTLAVDESLATIQALNPQSVELQCFDLMNRKDYQNKVIVFPETISFVSQRNGFFKIFFVDGSTLDVVSVDGLPQ